MLTFWDYVVGFLFAWFWATLIVAVSAATVILPAYWVFG